MNGPSTLISAARQQPVALGAVVASDRLELAAAGPGELLGSVGCSPGAGVASGAEFRCSHALDPGRQSHAKGIRLTPHDVWVYPKVKLPWGIPYGMVSSPRSIAAILATSCLTILFVAVLATPAADPDAPTATHVANAHEPTQEDTSAPGAPVDSPAPEPAAEPPQEPDPAGLEDQNDTASDDTTSNGDAAPHSDDGQPPGEPAPEPPTAAPDLPALVLPPLALPVLGLMTSRSTRASDRPKGSPLVASQDGGGDRHFLDGKPVAAGSLLEILMPSGKWLPVRYESSWDYGFHPRLFLEVGPTHYDSEGDAITGDAEIILRVGTWDCRAHSDPDAIARARFRWPTREPWYSSKPRALPDDVLDTDAARRLSA